MAAGEGPSDPATTPPRSGKRRRVRPVTVGFVALAVVAVMLVVAAVADNSDSYEVTGVEQVRSTFEGVPQDGLRLGSADAPVTVTLLEDIGCLTCASLLEPRLAPELEEIVRRGDARLAFRHWNVLGPETTRGAKAALAAAEQDRYWQYLALLVRNRGEGTEWQEVDDLLPAVARASGVDVERWSETIGSGGWQRREWQAHLRTSARIARERGIERPPGYVVEGPGGRRVLEGGGATLPAVRRAIDEVRRG